MRKEKKGFNAVSIFRGFLNHFFNIFTFIDNQRVVHAKGLSVNIKDCSLDKDLLVGNSLVTVALLEDIGCGQPIGGERVLGDMKETCSQVLVVGLAGEGQEGRGKGDEEEGSNFNHCGVKVGSFKY